MPDAPSVSTGLPVPEKVNAPAPLANTTPATLRLAARLGWVGVAVPKEARFVRILSAGAVFPVQFVPVAKSVPTFAHEIVCASAAGTQTTDTHSSNARRFAKPAHGETKPEERRNEFMGLIESWILEKRGENNGQKSEG